MSFRLTLDISDLARINANIIGLNVDPIYRAIGEHLKTKTEMAFRQETSPKGEPWKPSKRAQATGDKTLVDTAFLKNSITYQVEDNELGFGPGPLPYAAIHQFGGKAGRGKKVEIPRRQYIPEPEDLDEHDLKEIGEIVRLGLLRGLGKA